MRSTPWARVGLAAAVALSGAAGLLAPHGGIAVDAELATLLRFMAVLKAAMALTAYGLLDWRLRTPAAATAAAGAAAAVCLMAAAAGLIWSLTFVVAGAVLFHIGLLSLLGLAWRESRGGRARLLGSPRRAQDLRPSQGLATSGWATGTATSFLRRNGSVQGGS